MSPRWFTARVLSGSFPLYRLMMLGMFISGVLQVVMGDVPDSIQRTSPLVFDYVYLVMQTAGSALVLVALVFVDKAARSLYLERVGAATLVTSCLMYFGAVSINNAGPPTSSGWWLVATITFYLLYRSWYEIPRDLGRLRKKAQRLIAQEQE